MSFAHCGHSKKEIAGQSGEVKRSVSATCGYEWKAVFQSTMMRCFSSESLERSTESPGAIMRSTTAACPSPSDSLFCV